MYLIFKTPGEFERLFTEDFHLTETAKLFPEYAHVFGKSSLSEAATAAELFALTKISYAEIRKSARIIAQGKRTDVGQSFFNRLPGGLHEQISIFFSNPKVHDEDKSIRVAKKFSGDSNFLPG